MRAMNETDDFLADDEFMLDDARRILEYEAQLARGERPGTLTADDDAIVQGAWDLFTEGAGSTRTNVWTGAPLQPRSRWQRIQYWGVVNRHFAPLGHAATAAACAAAIGMSASALSRALTLQWPHRNDIVPFVRPYDPEAISIHAGGLRTVTAVLVPPVGGPSGSSLKILPDGVRLYLAPGADATRAPRQVAAPGYNCELRGEARFELTKGSGVVDVGTEVGFAEFRPPGKYALRGTSTEMLVSTFYGSAIVFAQRSPVGPNLTIG